MRVPFIENLLLRRVLVFVQALVEFVQGLEDGAIQGLGLEQKSKADRSLINQEILKSEAIKQQRLLIRQDFFVGRAVRPLRSAILLR